MTSQENVDTTVGDDGEDGEFVEAQSSDEQISKESLAFLKQKIEEVTSANSVLKFLTGQVKTAGLRLAPNQRYLALEDFQRADPEKKRIVLIGCTGAGKSTIGNIAAGWKLVGKMDSDGDFDFTWKHPEGLEPLFEARASGESVTDKTSFANVSWLGDEVWAAVALSNFGRRDGAGA